MARREQGGLAEARRAGRFAAAAYLGAQPQVYAWAKADRQALAEERALGHALALGYGPGHGAELRAAYVAGFLEVAALLLGERACHCKEARRA